MNRGLPATQLEYQLTVLNGPDKGAVYRLIARQVTLGRGNECDIVIREDGKVSRTHARISVTPDGAEISDISDRNRILVNGDDSPRQSLKHNAVIQLGETKLQFKFADSAQAKDNGLAVSPRNELNKASNFLRNQMGGLNKKMRHPNGKPSLMPMIIILAMLGGFGYYMSNKEDTKPKTVRKLGSEAEILRQTASIEEELSALEEERKRQGLTDEEFVLQVQSHYVKGLRDYNNGQYERAIESFKACMALNKDHKTCQQYKNDSERLWAQVINEQIKLGQRYKSQNQYAACFAAFNNVKIAVKVRTDARFIEADANAKFCEKKMEGRY